MDRRILFKQLVALFGVPTVIAAGTSSANSASGHIRDELLPPCSWLEDWLRLPMQPVVSLSDLDCCLDPGVWDLATRVLIRSSESRSLNFRYHGGSDPGTVRSVLPMLLFRKFDPEIHDGATAGNRAAGPLYLLAHCQARNSPRTFRLDRMEPTAVPRLLD